MYFTKYLITAQKLLLPINSVEPTLTQWQWARECFWPRVGGKENRFMKKNTVEYSKGEMGAVKIIKDFLPHPSALVLKDDNVKVTLSLSRRSIEFFKREAKRQHVPYQKMIRALVDGYAERVGK
jgi:predicted DNA binding CopG/RHH family protein